MTEETLILVDGEPASSVKALDRGLQYGDGVFRTMKTVNGRIRWWHDQYRKLAEDCAVLGIPSPDRKVLQAEVERLAAEPGVGVIKILVTRGIGQRGYGINQGSVPTRIVMGFPFSGRENLDVRVRWCELRLSHQPRLAGIKHLNRLENVLARSEWGDPEIAEGLLMDEAGNVICGTMTNLMLVEAGRLVTPDVSRCGVAGVARHLIMEAAKRHGQLVSVEDVSRERVMAADEVLLCNSLVEVWRVSELEKNHWQGTGWAEKLRSWLDENN